MTNRVRAGLGLAGWQRRGIGRSKWCQWVLSPTEEGQHTTSTPLTLAWLPGCGVPAGGAVAEQTVAEARSVMQFVHAVALLVDAQRALELREGLTHREVTLASGGRTAPIVGSARAALEQRSRAPCACI